MRYYLDCEFDGYRGHLISVALVREDGHSGYWVVSDVAGDPWVRENVLPILYTAHVGGKHVPMETCVEEIASFLKGDPAPVIVTDWPDDVRYFCELSITGPGTMIDVPGLKFEVHRVDAYPTELEGAVQHNAWWDAMALRHLLTKETVDA